LQALRQDFGPWRQLTGRPTDTAALLLLQGGSAAASERWTVPSTAAWWAQDLGGNVTSVAASGDYATVTDADGVQYTVGVNQAFIVSSNPGTVLLVTPGSAVMSMSLAQATAVRQPLAR
jgi:ABC-type Fe3+-hydroxamate transport system substrate-binding protein